MTIKAHVRTNGSVHPVQILDCFESGDGHYMMALITTLDGSKPFTHFSHGGPSQDAGTMVRADFLFDVVMIEQEASSEASSIFSIPVVQKV